MIIRMNHTGFVVRDLQKAVEFYRDVLGLDLLMERERSGGPISQVLGYDNTHIKVGIVGLKGDHGLELIEYVSPAASERPSEERSVLGGGHLAFEVDDVDRMHEELVSRGAKKLNPPVEVAPGRKVCYLQDPEGNWIELMELRE